MAEAPRRRLLDQLGSSPCFIAPGARFVGDIETEGPLVVCGSVRGDGNVRGMLSLTAAAEWTGEVHAQDAVVAGRVTGRLAVEGKLELGSTAVVQADVVAGRIIMARGAVLEGELDVTSGEPVVRFEERRGT